MGYKVVVAGATGNVGREMLNILAEREFPVDEIAALASRNSLGTEISFGDKTVKTRDLDTFDFKGWDIALFAVGSEATKLYAPRAAAAGCIVIDNSSLYRYDPQVPLIVPEVNADQIVHYKNKNIIANPNCSTAQMVVVLKPLHDRARIKRVVVSTYQSVSGAGKEGIDELWDQTKGIYVHGQEVAPKKFPKQIAFNVIPQIDVFLDDGYTKEEWKMVAETKKILDKSIKVTATCVRVPVFVGHSEVSTSSSTTRSTGRKPPTSCAKRRASWSSINASRVATSPPSNASATTPPMSAASGRTARSKTASRCG